LLQNLPRDPDEQLRLGLQVIEMAYTQKTRQLEQEVRQSTRRRRARTQPPAHRQLIRRPRF
jgi:hypothetical protein